VDLIRIHEKFKDETDLSAFAARIPVKTPGAPELDVT
jgi:hypothetical protein